MRRNAAEFAWRSDDVFGRIAGRYDALCDVFSLGIHRLWKRRVAHHIGSQAWSTLLDGATGTGDIILRVLPRSSAQGRTIIASDVSFKMLAIAEKRLRAFPTAVKLAQLDLESMPSIADGSVDAYSISLGLKICDRRSALLEALRVLRPGGRLIVLEASNISWGLLHRAYLAYMSICMPVLGWLVTGGDASAYRYLLHGIRDFPTAEALARELTDLGFEEVQFERLSLGIVAIHLARKPNDDAAQAGRHSEVRRVAMRSTVLASFEAADGTLCVDVFERENGTFGFEQYRSDADGMSRWQSLGTSSQLSFASGEEALRVAKQRVPWLSPDEVWRW